MPVHLGQEQGVYPRQFAQYGETGKKYYFTTSHGEQIARARAEAQQRAIHASEGAEGAGFIDHVKGFWNALKGNRTNLKPGTRENMKKLGDQQIVKMEIMRRPLSGALQTVMKGLSAFNKKKKEIPPDGLFHLGIVGTLANGKKVLLEKREDLDFEEYKPTKVDELTSIALPPDRALSPRSMLNQTLDKFGKKRVMEYDAFNRNCQDFVMDNLEANQIPVSEQERSWIKQDTKGLIPSWAERITKGLTDLANRGKMALVGYGAGAYSSRLRHFVKGGALMLSNEEMAHALGYPQSE